MKLSQMTGTIEQRVCLFGPPKVGKTLLAAKLAKHYKIIIFDLENGTSVCEQLPPEYHDRIDIIKIRDSAGYPIASETMLKVIKGAAVNICVAHSKVACPVCSKNGAMVERICLNEVGLDTIVIVDSLTQFTLSCLSHITKGQPDDYKLQLDDWGNLKKLIETFLSYVQTAKYHVICISHEEEVEFEDKRTRIVPVAGSSKSSRNTAKYFDHVVYCNVVNKKHVVGSATDYSTSILAGSRTNVKLEANKEGGDLLDLFTNWKLPNFGMPISAATEEVENIVAIEVAKDSVEVTSTVPLSPAQIALANLKNRK